MLSFHNGWTGYVYCVSTDVKVVDAVSGRTIFNNTYETTIKDKILSTGGERCIIFNGYSGKKYAEEISEIVGKGLHLPGA